MSRSRPSSSIELGRRGVRARSGDAARRAASRRRNPPRRPAHRPHGASRRRRSGPARVPVVFDGAHVPFNLAAVLRDLARVPELAEPGVAVVALAADKDARRLPDRAPQARVRRSSFTELAVDQPRAPRRRPSPAGADARPRERSRARPARARSGAASSCAERSRHVAAGDGVALSRRGAARRGARRKALNAAPVASHASGGNVAVAPYKTRKQSHWPTRGSRRRRDADASGRPRSTSGSSRFSTGLRGTARRTRSWLGSGTSRRNASPTTSRARRRSSISTRRARTLDIGVEGAKEANPALVGLPDLPPDLRLRRAIPPIFPPAARQAGRGVRRPVSVAPGARPEPSRRRDGNPAIAGQLGRRRTEHLHVRRAGAARAAACCSRSTSRTKASTARARPAARPRSSSTNDSVSALHALTQIVSKQIDLLYLDSFDLDPNNPLPSAIHHALELTAVRPLIGPGTIICVDDYAVGSSGGKGMIVDRFMSNIRAKVLYSGYQKVWRLV